MGAGLREIRGLKLQGLATVESHHHQQDQMSKGCAIVTKFHWAMDWWGCPQQSQDRVQQMSKTLHESREGFFHSGIQLETAKKNPAHTPLRINFKGTEQGREEQ